MRHRQLFLLPLALLLCAAATGAKLRQIAILDLPGRPGFDAMVLAKGELAIAHKGANTVEIFDPGKRRVIAQVADMADPRGLAFEPRSGKLYVANQGNKTVAVINSQGWNVESTIALPLEPENLLLVPQGNRLYVAAARDRALMLVDPQAGAVAGTIELDGRPSCLLYDAGRSQLYVSLQDRNQVAVLDSANHVVRRFPLAASQPMGLALDTTARRLYVAVRYAVLVLNADDGSELARAATPAGTDTLWLDSPSGTLYAAADGSVNILRVSGNALVNEHELNSSVKGHVLAFDPVKKLLFFPGGMEGRSKLAILRHVDSSLNRSQESVGSSQPAARGTLKSELKPTTSNH